MLSAGRDAWIKATVRRLAREKFRSRVNGKYVFDRFRVGERERGHEEREPGERVILATSKFIVSN